MSNNLHLKNLSCLAVAGIYPPKHLRRRTATVVSPLHCNGLCVTRPSWPCHSREACPREGGERESSIENPSSFLCFLLKVGCSTFYVGRLSSVTAPLHLSRELYKSTLFMQNKANSYHGHPARGSLLSVCNITRYVNVRHVGLPENEPKNKAKQSQFKPNFSPILALFFPTLALFSPMMTINSLLFVHLEVTKKAKKFRNNPCRGDKNLEGLRIGGEVIGCVEPF